MKKIFFFTINFLFFAGLFAQKFDLGQIVTVVSSPVKNEIILTEKNLEDFNSTEDALESVGFSFKSANNEATFHGLWNSSVKVFVNGVLMNDANTGKFDFSSLDISSVKSIKVSAASSFGGVCVYISTFSADFEKNKFWIGGNSKSYLNNFNDAFSVAGGFSLPFLLKNGSSLFLQENFGISSKENRFGYNSTEASYKPKIDESYKKTKTFQKYRESFLTTNSFFAEYSDFRFPGATFGLNSYFSFLKENCGSKDKKQKDFALNFALPVFLPFENFNLKILPSYKRTNLIYNEGNFENRYFVNNFSLQSETSVFQFFKAESNISYDFSTSNNSNENLNKNHNLLTAFFSAGSEFNFLGFDFSFFLPVNFFAKSDFDFYEVDFLFNFLISKSFENFKISFQSVKSATNPVFQQLYYDGAGGIGNENLKSETAVSFYTGFLFSPQKLNGLCFELKPFLIFYKDKIQWNYENSLWRVENLGSSRNYGFDFCFSTGKLFSFFTLEANYTFCRAILASGENKGNQIMYTPVHSASSKLKIPFLKYFDFETDLTFNSEKATDNSNTTFIPETFFWNSSLSFEKGKFYIQFKWNNMLDFKYVLVDGYPSSGTSFEAKVKIKF